MRRTNVLLMKTDDRKLKKEDDVVREEEDVREETYSPRSTATRAIPPRGKYVHLMVL